MFWGKGPDKPKPPPTESVPPEQPPANDKGDSKDVPKDFDPAKLPTREKLPRDLQKIVDREDKEDNFYNEIVSG